MVGLFGPSVSFRVARNEVAHPGDSLQRKGTMQEFVISTVDGRNPKQPPGMYKTL